MNLGSMIKALQLELQDSSVPKADMIARINEALAVVAANSWLPDLMTEKEVVLAAWTNYTQMPDDYDHDMWEVYSKTSGTYLDMVTSLQNLRNMYRQPDPSRATQQYGGYSADPYKVRGTVRHYAVEGERLWFLPIPENDEEMKISYYRKPAVLTDETAEPTWLPSDLHRRLVVDQIMGTTFCLVQEAVDDRDIALRNTYYVSSFNQGIAMLGRRFPQPSKQKNYIPRGVHWF